jgi:hypothetical protein
MMRLAPAGIREWGGGGVVAIVVTAAVWWLVPIVWVNWTVTSIVAMSWLCTALFFRDPFRRPSTSLKIGAMISPADGTVSAVERLEHHEFIDGPAIARPALLRLFELITDLADTSTQDRKSRPR